MSQRWSYKGGGSRQLAGVCLMWLLLSITGQVLAADVESMRLWAAPDHARLVFDLSSPGSATVFELDSPSRLVIDLENSQLKTDASTLPLEGSAISSIRSGVRDGTDLRIVLDLDREVSPRHFSLTPNDQYGHRLVVDLEYPGEAPVENPIDPIESLVREQEIAAQRTKVEAAASGTPPTVTEEVVDREAQPHPRRDIIIAVDPGHGGEDPGAIGPKGTREKDIVLQISQRLAAHINKTPGFRAVMIRDGDYYIGLRQRKQLSGWLTVRIVLT